MSLVKLGSYGGAKLHRLRVNIHATTRNFVEKTDLPGTHPTGVTDPPVFGGERGDLSAFVLGQCVLLFPSLFQNRAPQLEEVLIDAMVVHAARVEGLIVRP
jgi:hypothetical protein